MRRHLIGVFAVGALAAVAWSATGGASENGTSSVFRVKAGDRIVVAGAPLGCRVKRMRQLGGVIALDCRRGGRLRGSYGTLLTAREAMLVRFESNTTARRVATATHRGELACCR